MESKRIWNVEMDHSDFSTEGLATTGLGPCHGFIAILNQGQHVFIEHRSDMFIASLVSEREVADYFDEVMKQIHHVLPGSTIT
jgi:hypothetical protein